MKSAGMSRNKFEEKLSNDTGSSETDKIYPSMTVDHKAMPHMKKHNVGDTGEMMVKYKVTSQNQYKSGEGHTGMDITHYEPAKRVKGKTDKEMQDKAKEDEDKQPTANQE